MPLEVFGEWEFWRELVGIAESRAGVVVEVMVIVYGPRVWLRGVARRRRLDFVGQR